MERASASETDDPSAVHDGTRGGGVVAPVDLRDAVARRLDLPCDLARGAVDGHREEPFALEGREVDALGVQDGRGVPGGQLETPGEAFRVTEVGRNRLRLDPA